MTNARVRGAPGRLSSIYYPIFHKMQGQMQGIYLTKTNSVIMTLFITIFDKFQTLADYNQNIIEQEIIRFASQFMEGNLTRTFDTPITTNDQSLDRVLSTGMPVVLVFLNGPTPAQLEQVMDRLAREYAGAVLIAKIQIQDNPIATRRYQVTQAPAVILARGEQVLAKAEAISGTDLEKYILYLLGKGPKPGMQQATHPADTPRQTGNQPKTVNDASFEQEVLRSSLPVVVDFWAPWCGPCRMTEPIIQKLSGEMAGRVSFVKINVDENPVSSQRYAVQSIPTMMVVKDGKILDRWTGALPEPALRSRLSNLVRS